MKIAAEDRAKQHLSEVPLIIVTPIPRRSLHSSRFEASATILRSSNELTSSLLNFVPESMAMLLLLLKPNMSDGMAMPSDSDI